MYQVSFREPHCATFILAIKDKKNTCIKLRPLLEEAQKNAKFSVEKKIDFTPLKAVSQGAKMLLTQICY